MAFRDDLQALQARHEVLATEVTAKQRERDHVRTMLDEAKTRAKLPVLANLTVAAPCSADWSQMTPANDERVRNCGDCKKDVFNLTDMTRDEAEALIVAKAGNLCVRYFQRHDGTILLADCTVGAKRRRRRKLVVIAGATALLAGGVAAYTKLVHHHEEPEIVMGRMAVDTREVMGQAVAPIAPPHDGTFVMGNK